MITIASAALAHTRSESFSHWHLSETGIAGTVTIPVREVMALYDGGNASISPQILFKTHLEESTQVFSLSQACTRTSSTSLQAASGFVSIELQYDCQIEAPDRLHYRALFAIAPAHVHYAKLHRDGLLLNEALITDSADTLQVSDFNSDQSWSFAAFFKIGLAHIAGGIDHIAFLLGLLLIAGSVGRSIVAVTGFTIGHSISLAAAVLGYVRADGQLVEAFIGLTVALVAIEFFVRGERISKSVAFATLFFTWAIGAIAFSVSSISLISSVAYTGIGIFAACYLLLSTAISRANDQRGATFLLVTTTVCFGLIHGFGFAGFLMETGLLGTSLFVPLLGFNLGVEVGQLVIVALTLLGANLLRRHMHRLLPQYAAAGLCAFGVFWFVDRTIA
jgi:hypothetical protein